MKRSSIKTFLEVAGAIVFMYLIYQYAPILFSIMTHADDLAGIAWVIGIAVVIILSPFMVYESFKEKNKTISHLQSQVWSRDAQIKKLEKILNDNDIEFHY
jgi:hypothetical protein